MLEGKRVLLVEDSIVRSTTMKVLLKRIRELGHAREIHVRVACPPIVAPCFYGIDMSTIGELFAPQFLKGGPLTEEVAGRDGRPAGRRFAPLSAGRVDRPRDRLRQPTSFARPASRASIPRRPARICIRSPCKTSTLRTSQGRTYESKPVRPVARAAVAAEDAV